MKILAVALFVVAMAALTTADGGVSILNPAPEDMVPEIPLNETTEPDGFPQSDVSILNPALEGRVPEIPLNETTQTRGFLQPPVRQKRQTQDDTNLKWVTWGGSLPGGAVAIYNSDVKRYDYVCKYGCHAGFYTPGKGSYCHIPYGDKELKGNKFEILVNEGNLENLVWKDGSHGSVPQNSVRTCSGSDIYVGKNKYGLGKVHVRHKALFLLKDGKEYTYKSYQVLTYDTVISSEQISNVRYNTKQAKTLEYPPETLSNSSTTNLACKTVTKTVMFKRMQQVVKTWDTSIATTLGVKTTMTAKIPVIGKSGVEYGFEIRVDFAWGTTVVNRTSYSSSVQVTVPPNHSCSVSMVGYRYSADIPFTALLTRKFRSGKPRSWPITGMYKGVDTYKVRTVVQRCTPIPNARHCPKMKN